MARCSRIFKEGFAKRIIHFAREQICLTKWNSIYQNERASSNIQFIIRTDGSSEVTDQLAGIGSTINKNDKLISAGAFTVRASSIIYAEVIAIQAGLQEAEKKNLSNFVLYSDSLASCNKLLGV